NVFKEIEVDKDEVLMENEKTMFEKNDVIVLNNSEKKNEKVQTISIADKAFTSYKEIKVYMSQSTTLDQR
ncbi:10999_t:CDS:1, partial [Racocetra persica]